MESNLSFFSLPFIDNADVDFTLPSHGSLLGTDDVLAQFLSGDELLEEPDLNGPTILHCEICRKQFDNAKKYYGHLRVHCKDYLWICDKCPNEKFSTKQHLMKHSLTHKPLERVWRCSQCDMAFEALWRLQQHLFAKHIDYRPHKCDKCEMSFHKLSDLKKHKDIHDDVRKHQCKVCKKGFNDVSNLKRHMLSHGNEKPYPCPGCGNRFKQLASMKRHSRNCTMIAKQEQEIGNKIRKNHCRVCGLTFQYKSALLEHCVRQHSNNPPSANEASNQNKSNDLNNDANHTNISQIIDNTVTTHPDTPHNNISNLVNIHTNQLNIDSNQVLNVDANNQMNLNTLTNSMNANTNPAISLGTNLLMNMNTSIPINLNTNTSINIHTSSNIDRNQTVDNIVDDILSAEDDYLIRDPMSNQILNFNPPEAENQENVISQIELMKEMNHMHMLDDELLCHDLDFDTFQTMCNTNDMDYTDRDELLFDIPDGRSMDQDIMNALYQVRGDIPDLLNEPEILNTTEKVSDYLTDPAVSVNECATIFESDVDLEASTNLAANLNQLIGENSVQYISTEHDDTFIISLNSEIDAEQLTDMLNIGVESVEESSKSVQEVKEVKEKHIEPAPQPILVKIEKAENNIPKSSNQSITQPTSVKIQPDKEIENKVSEDKKETTKIVKSIKRVYYVCRKCDKIFNKKDNYKSHRATHEPSLRQHACRVCGERFSYRSTLNKHVRRRHTPLVAAAHACHKCDKTYQAVWMLKRHIARDHDLILPFKCKEKDCGKRFYKQADLDVHMRFHKDERPHTCDTCHRSFYMMSHLKRHMQKHQSTKDKVLVNSKSCYKPLIDVITK